MRRRILTRGGLVVAALIFALVFAEIGLRVASPIRSEDLLPLSYNREAIQAIAAGGAYLRFDGDLGWIPAPSTERNDDDARYKTNGDSIRSDREYARETPPGTRRLAAFGDSFTHCDEVNNPECWTAQLEQSWQSTEVLNFGVPGYGPDQGWLRYERDGRPYRPCGVLIGYMIENVHRVVNRFRPFYAPQTGIALSKPRFILQGDDLTLLPNPATSPELLTDPRWVEETLGPNDPWYFPGMFVPHPLDALQIVRVARSAAYRRARAALDDKRGEDHPLAPMYREGDPAFQVTGRVVTDFARAVQRDGATPVVVVFTGKDELVTLRHGEPKVYQPLLDWLDREGIPTVDASDALARQANRSGVDRLVARQGHYSRQGNQVVAEALARQLPALVAPTCGGR
jgi:hypothetical protein